MRLAKFAAFLGTCFLILLGGGSQPAPWPVEQAARIKYDRTTDTFVLTNLSPHIIWYDGRPNDRPSPIYERQLPTGKWVNVWLDGCGTKRGWQPLRPGQAVVLGQFPDRVGRGMGGGSPEARALAERNDLNKLAARVGLRVISDPKNQRATGKLVYSDAMTLP